MLLGLLFQLHEPDPVLRAHNQLSFEGFARYLMDSANSAIDLNDNEAGQDLDQPLSRYYVATSHNTYLVGHQLKGLSSVQLYREVGARNTEDSLISLYSSVEMQGMINLHGCEHQNRKTPLIRNKEIRR